MSRESTLQKVEAEINEGKLGIARDRLHGLVTAYPGDISLRSKLGDVYDKLGYPREAGRWWFLDVSPSEQKLEAISLFVKDCKADPSVILKRLKLPETLVEESAKLKVKELIEECGRRGLEAPPFKASRISQRTDYSLVSFGCFVIAVLIGFFALLGVVVTIQALKP